MIKRPWQSITAVLISTALQLTTSFSHRNLVDVTDEQNIDNADFFHAKYYQDNYYDTDNDTEPAASEARDVLKQDFSVEQQLTAALIYKLTGFVEFPNEPSSFTMCFSGKNGWAISEVLEAKFKEGKLKQSIKVLKHSALSKIEPLACQFIYISPASRLEESTIRQLSRDALTISDSDDFRNIGHISSIQFVNAKPVISISKKGLKASNIQLSSRLLNSITVRP